MKRKTSLYPVDMRHDIDNSEGSGGGGSTHNYSTEEKKVGKWINGEDIYEKTFTGVTPSNDTVMFSVSGMTKLIDLEGSLKNTEGNYYSAINSYFSGGDSHSVYTSGENFIYYAVGSKNFGAEYNITVKYLK